MPRVITDPVDGGSVDYYLVNLDGNVQHVEPERDGDQARLAWPLPDGLTDGDHNVSVAAGNEWGDSPFSSPFLFAKSLPSTPTGIAIEFTTENA